jgi:N-acetylglucosamine repressor
MLVMDIVTGSFQLMKKMNKTLILDLIRQQGPISRAEIAKLTKLTPPTVTNLVRDLLQTGIIVEGERTSSTGGRKAISLLVNPVAYYVIGVDVGISKVVAVVTDLEASIIAKVTTTLVDEDKSAITDIILQSIKDVIGNSKVNRDNFIGIGIGMHGLVESDTGTAVFAPNFGLHNVPIKKIIQDELQIPVYLDNDVRAMALGESWFGHGQETKNFVFVNVGMGIGAGIYLNDSVYHGVSQSAGEVGHTTVIEDGPLCSCGNYGCLEVMAAGPGIVNRMIKEIKRGTYTSITQKVGTELNDITAKMIYEEAKAGDELSKQIIKNTGKFLGIGIANLINILNPEKVIIGGGISEAGDLLFEPLVQTVMIRAMEVPAKVVNVYKTNLGENAGVIGAATLVLKELFKGTELLKET